MAASKTRRAIAVAPPELPLTTALDVVERMLLREVATTRKVVESTLRSAIKPSPEERRRIRAIGAGLRFAGNILNELLDENR